MPWSAARARLAVLAAAALFSTGGAAIKGTSLGALEVAGFRSAVAALTLLALLPAARRGYSRALLPAAGAYAATLVCFVVATKLTTSAAAIFLQSTAPVWVLLLGPLLAGEVRQRRDLLAVSLAAAGLLLVFLGSRDPSATAPRPATGNAAALVSGLFYALLMLSLRRLGRQAGDRSIPATVLGNAVAFAACAPWILPPGDWSGRDLAAIVYLGVLQIGFAYWLFTRALGVLPAVEVSLLVLLEPVLNPLWTWLLHGERPSLLASAGGAVMVVALAARTLGDRRRRPPLPPPPD